MQQLQANNYFILTWGVCLHRSFYYYVHIKPAEHDAATEAYRNF